MQADCKRWARTCIPCQRSKTHRHVNAPLGDFLPPSSRFEHVHVDLIGPLPSSRRHRYCVTCVDRFTRWPEAFPVEDITAESVARALYTGWISRYGVPLRITSDQGRQFESELFRALACSTGMTHLHTTAYHPQSNGMVERLHRQLKAAIMCHATADWSDRLPTVLLGLRAAWKPDINATAAELVFGEPIRVPGEFLSPRAGPQPDDPASYAARLRRHFAELQPAPGSRHATRRPFMFQDLSTTTHVFIRSTPIRRALEPPYEGPFPVTARHSKFFTVTVRGRDTPVSVDRLKPAYLADDLQPAPPPPASPRLPETSPPAAGCPRQPPRADHPPDQSPGPAPPPRLTDDRVLRSGRRVHYAVPEVRGAPSRARRPAVTPPSSSCLRVPPARSFTANGVMWRHAATAETRAKPVGTPLRSSRP